MKVVVWLQLPSPECLKVTLITEVTRDILVIMNFFIMKIYLVFPIALHWTFWTLMTYAKMNGIIMSFEPVPSWTFVITQSTAKTLGSLMDYFYMALHTSVPL